MLLIGTVVFAQTAITHTVERGETLEDIARKYNVTVEMIKEANPNMDGLFYTGMVLNIPTRANNDESASPPTNLSSDALETAYQALRPQPQPATTPTTTTPSARVKNDRDINTCGLMLWMFSSEGETYENYGMTTEALTYNGFGVEAGFRTVFKEHGNYNIELGINYSLGLYKNEGTAVMLVGSWGPLSLRKQDTYDANKGRYKMSVFLDTYVSARMTVKMGNFALTGGYIYWVPKWGVDIGSDGLNGYCIGIQYAW